MIKQCRVCQSKKLKYALKIKDMIFVICQSCTLLQRQEDVAYEIQFNFEGGYFELDYYPVFLSAKHYECVSEDSVLFFSLQAIDRLLYSQGYKLTHARVTGERLVVGFEKLNELEAIQRYEKIKRLDNQFTFFLWAVKKQSQ